MDPNNPQINKHISIIHRTGQAYFDTILSPFHIGCGQQFFLLAVSGNPGISQLDLAQNGGFDQGTTARAVKKLEALGYLRRVADAGDKRINKLYVTEQAGSALAATRAALKSWQNILTASLASEEKETASRLLERMASGACAYMKEQKKGKMN